VFKTFGLTLSARQRLRYTPIRFTFNQEITMNAKPALVRPRFASEFDPQVALWISSSNQPIGVIHSR